MFKGYLREHPPIFQLSVFVGIWSILQLITYLLLPKIISISYGADVATLGDTELSTAQEVNVFMLINGISTILCFILPPILFASVAAPKISTYLEIKSDITSRIILSIFIGIGMVLVFPILSHWINQVNWGESATANMRQLVERNQAIFSDTSLNSLFRNIIIMALLPAIGEELFFRSIVQRFANSLLKNPLYAIIFTSLFFSLIHLQIVNFVPIFLASCLLGYIFHITGNLLLTIVIHFVYNATQILLRYSAESPDAPPYEYLVLFGIGIAIIICCIVLFRRKQTPLPKFWSVYQPADSQQIKNNY